MIIETHQLVLFIAAGWLLNLTPGPDVLYIVTQSMRSGARAGLVGALGITAGCLVHVTAAAVGVGALLAASATAFTVLKWVGAAYLLWMGIRLLLAKPAADPGGTASLAVGDAASAPALRLRQVFMGGFWTNVLNPKVAIFFLAFVPQFIAPSAPSKAWAFVLLGLLFVLNSLPVCAGWALVAAWMARRMDAVQRAMHWLDRVAGVMFVGFGLKLALTDAPAP